MVLSRARAALRGIAIAIAVAAAAALAASCDESLFNAHGGGDDGGGGGDGGLPSACPAPCIADAAADFDGTPAGVGQRWRYLDDLRDRTWAPMTAAGGAFTGADGLDQITACAPGSSEPACEGLPGALLVTSRGAAPRDPAIELAADAARVIQLSLVAHVPHGEGAQRVRFYRNSREDELFTGDVAAGDTLRKALLVDALPGDRFLVALEPADGASGGRAALHVYVSGTDLAFPASCLLGLAFESAVAFSQIGDLCDSRSFTATSVEDNDPMTIPSDLEAGPFLEQGLAAELALGQYYASPFADSLPLRDELTVQLWVRQDLPGASNAYVYSNIDRDAGGGLSLRLTASPVSLLEVASTLRGNANMVFIDTPAYPADAQWHFIRVVHEGDALSTCVDGVWRSSITVPVGNLGSVYPVYLGRNVEWEAVAPSFVGRIDDVRVFDRALPCRPPS